MMYGIPMMIGLIVLIYIVLSGFIGFQMGLGKFSLIAPSFGVIFLIAVKIICQDDPNAFAILKWKFKAIQLKLQQQNPIIYISSNSSKREAYNARRSFKKSKPIEDLLPHYRTNINDYVITVGGDKLLFTLKLSGIPFTSLSDNDLGSYFESLDDYFLSLAKEYSGDLAVWTHIVKKRNKLEQDYQFKSNFIQELADTYLSGFSGTNFFTTDYYITFVLKYNDLNDGLAKCANILATSDTLKRRYDGEELSIVDISESVSICENNEFLSYLLNSYKQTITLNESEVIDNICNSDWFFNYDYFEVRNKETTKSKYGTAYLLKNYPAKSSIGMWDFILELPYEFILSQSFIFTSAQKSIRQIEVQENKLSSSGDTSAYQQEELEIARGFLNTGEIAFGSYQASMLIFGETPEIAIENGSKVISAFTVEGRGTRWTKANLESVFAFVSVMPAAIHRPLESVRAHTNLVCGFSLHNYFGGNQKEMLSVMVQPLCH